MTPVPVRRRIRVLRRGAVRARVELRRDHAVFPQGVYEYSAERFEPCYVGGGWGNGQRLDAFVE
jgi:hypothetical protein